jgi:hypothetical protein
MALLEPIQILFCGLLFWERFEDLYPPSVVQSLRENITNEVKFRAILETQQKRRRELIELSIYRILRSSPVFISRLICTSPPTKKTLEQVVSPLTIILTFQVECVSLMILFFAYSFVINLSWVFKGLFIFGLVAFTLLSLSTLRAMIIEMAHHSIAIYPEWLKSLHRYTSQDENSLANNPKTPDST